jgi:C4-dicarboxylate-specific signal transduction histidine kinase
LFAVPVGTVLFAGGRLRAVDQGLLRLTGYAADALFDCPWGVLFADPTPVLPGPDEPPPEPFAASVRRRDGVIVATVVHAVSLARGDGSTAEIVLAVYDAAALDAKAREYAELVADAQRVRRQLIQADRLGGIGSIAAAVAHELNNPLCAVSGLIERLARKADPGLPESGLLDLAFSQCARMKQLVREVQRAALQEAEDARLFDLGQTLDAVTLLLGKHLKMARVAVRKEYGDRVMEMVGVEPRIRQALFGLIRAAGETAPEGGGELRIQTDRVGDRMRIVLRSPGSDPGDGRATARAVACALVAALGGEIRVEASAGETTTTVLLPVDVGTRGDAWNHQQY